MFRLKSIVPSDVLHTLYNSLIMPHFHYCLLTWGSTIRNGHKLHLLQKKALRLVDNSHYIAYTDPIFKKLHMVKIIDMFNIAVWKLYYKLMNDLLPPYFNYMKPNVPVVCDHYNVRNPKFHLPVTVYTKFSSHESQSGSRKFNLREPLFCYGGHIWSVSKYGKFCRITIFTRGRRVHVSHVLFEEESKLM